MSGYIMLAPVEGDLEPEEGLLDEAFDLGDGASFGKKPAWWILKALPPEHEISFSDRTRALKARYSFLVERPNEILEEGDWEEDQATLRWMQQAIWVASGIRLEWHLCFLMKPEDPSMPCRRWDRLSREAKPLKAPDPKLKHSHLLETRQLLSVMRALPRKGALWTAIRIAAFALDERQGDIALVLAWAGLEALFGPDSPGETVHRTTMNLGLFLESDGERAQELAGRAKKSYTLRSRVVHGRQSGLVPGSSPEKAAQALMLLDETIGWLREGTRRIALDDHLRETFQSPKKREEFLAALPFRRSLHELGVAASPKAGA